MLVLSLSSVHAVAGWRSNCSESFYYDPDSSLRHNLSQSWILFVFIACVDTTGLPWYHGTVLYHSIVREFHFRHTSNSEKNEVNALIRHNGNSLEEGDVDCFACTNMKNPVTKASVPMSQSSDA